jgi:hypothetical protein
MRLCVSKAQPEFAYVLVRCLRRIGGSISAFITDITLWDAENTGYNLRMECEE